MKKKYLLFSLILYMFFASFITVEANTIHQINMDISIDEGGNAWITEVWNVNVDQGTEGYKPYYNLGISTITDFTVSEGNTTYQVVTDWDIDASFEQKKYKNGIIKKEEGVELCWGISSYGQHNYTLHYKINDFIYKTKDGYQMIYWTLIPYELSEKPENVRIRVSSDKIDANNIGIWAYGKGGAPISYNNGYIQIESNGVLNSNEYITLLVKFPKDSFTITSSNLEKTFSEYYNMAEDGARHYTYKKTPFIISLILWLIPVLLTITIIIIIIIFVKYPLIGTNHIDFGTEKRKLKKKYKYYRNLPCHKDLFRTYWVAQSYGLVKKKTDFLGAILLKWIKNKIIEIRTTSTKGLLKKENTSIVLLSSTLLTNTLEKELYDMMYEASGDGVLETNEFEKWCNKNYSKILKWFDKVSDQESEKLLTEGKCQKLTKRVFKLFKVNVYQVDFSLKEEAEQLGGLERFLKDFSSLTDSHPIEFNMWEDYLMYAQIFGVAKQVAKDFKKLYPSKISDVSINEAIFIYDLFYSGMQTDSTVSTASSGGGGGSFGGGAGGGGFR